MLPPADPTCPEAWNTASQQSDTISYDGHKSTKGASKMRRDLINSEIAVLRDLLPLPASTRQRLSQLQLMALVCVYLRKANYFQQVFKSMEPEARPPPPLGFSKATNGFLMITTQNGKLLYISDNAAEYLGHSMEDLLIHGDSVYDIIDKQDHQAIQAELMRAPAATAAPADDPRMFLCRMNVSRNARRQMRFGDQKVVLIRGHYLSYLPLCSRNEPVFVATCTPIAMPETRECVVQGATNVFTSVHSMDMKFMQLDENGEFYLGHRSAEIQGLSWYQLVHWDNMRDVQSKHKLISTSDQDRACILLLRLQGRGGHWLWAHCVLQVKENLESSQHPVIICTCQVLSDEEAAVMRANAWLYHYYSMQGKLQYSLQYDAQTPAPAYYQQLLGYSHHHHPHEAAALHSAYLHAPISPHPGAHHLSPPVLPTAQYALPPAPYHAYPSLEPSQWPRYEHTFSSAAAERPEPAPAPCPAPFTSPQKRPATPPSPRRRLCAPTVVPPAGSPPRQPLPIKRRLMAYGQSGYGSYGWSGRGSPQHAASPGSERRDGHFGFSGGGGGGGGDTAVMTAARFSPLRLQGPGQKGVDPALETTAAQESWSFSPPWQESNQRVPDLVAPSHEAVGSPRLGDPHAVEQRPLLAGWADVSSLHDFTTPLSTSSASSPSETSGDDAASREETRVPTWAHPATGAVTSSSAVPLRLDSRATRERHQLISDVSP
ncbi:neuronal PAS domain-containing protein 4-like [Amphibalanus amphitrite]|uniref:neuronal PAS domain-containing protein 4-like n=1 Tax=Amphibalanus amphitrite TaxID=1232801 RepID=UPI001C8FE393|nr:neuronal PAS domain-containing protein 4-like [Amphibalanus amphitrite]